MGELKYAFNNFYEIAQSQGRKHPRKTALFVGEEKITYRALLDRVDQLAGYLAFIEVQPEERVALFMGNSWEFVVGVFALSKIGAIIVPINHFLKEEELNYILSDSGAVVLLASAKFEKIVQASEASQRCHHLVWEGGMRVTDEQNVTFEMAMDSGHQADPVMRTLDDLAVFFYTSGTTGKPKGAMLTNKNILSNSESGRLVMHVTPKDRLIVFLPMFHSFAFSIGVILPMYVGASIIIIKSLHPFSNIFKQTLIRRVTIFFGVPDVYSAIARAKLPWYFMVFNRIRLFISGAAALQPQTLEMMHKKFSRATLLEGYGLSESSPATAINPIHKPKPKSVGPAMPGFEITIVDANMVEVPPGDVGDIILHGDHVMQGYLNRPEATAETIINGWLLTGDMGYKDEEGYLYIVDRKKDLVISKGINIYPREIEEVIDYFDGVKVSAVVGITDEKSGEIPVAYIELEEDLTQIDETALRKHLRKHLANFKVPRQIHVVETLPKNATGKVLKRLLKEQRNP